MIKEIENVLINVFSELGYKELLAKLSISKFPELFDYQINSVFALSNEFKKSPEEIANTIIDELNKLDNYSFYFDKVELAKPGFINIKLSENIINKYINNVLNNPVNTNPKKYFMDYGGPNIAKPLHVGHLRPAILGESIKRILKYTGNEVISDAHLGDFGLQIGEVIYGLKKESISITDITLETLSVIYPKINKLCKEDENILKECQLITKDLQEGNEEYLSYWKKICELSLTDIKRLYNYLGVSFDMWNGESDSYKYIPKVVKYLGDRNLVREDAGAKIIDIKESSDTKEMPPLLLQKSDGAYLYSTTDLATIYERMEIFNPDYILYITDDRQRLHFEQVFRVCKKSELSKSTILEHNYLGTVNGIDGKPFKTRSGDLLKLDELINDVRNIFLSKKEDNKSMDELDINKIVNSIIKFADLQNNREMNYVFDINKFSDTTGKTGPYILYTACRIRKILNDNNCESDNLISGISKNDAERNLKVKLIDYYNQVLKSANERMPHYIADYLYDLCVSANSFYQSNNISNETNINIKQSWLLLLSITYTIIERLLNLLVIDIPSKM